MTTLRRGAALFALSWYLSVGFGLPLADGLIFHRNGDVFVTHIEDVNNDCHRQQCRLEAPGAPQAPANAPVVLADPARLPVLVLPTRPEHDRVPATFHSTHSARAPPQLT